jgi:hypothetical protein
MNSNEVRNYPLHDQATKQSADGAVLPDGIIADLNIMLPESAGKFIYLSSAAVTPGLVSLTFLATAVDPLLPEESSSSPSESSSSLVPIASITVAKPVTIYKHYAIEALYPGVAGWVAFGSDVDEVTAAYRFVEPLDGLLCSKAVRAYRDLPITSIGKTGRLTELTGLVRFANVGDVLVNKGVRTIGGRRKEVVTIGLNLTENALAMLRKYAGECGGRPEDRTCKQGKPFVTINGVQPDCEGNIDIIFEGLDTIQTGVPGGMMVDIPVGLDDVCAEFDPWRYDPVDACESSSSPSPTPPSSSSPEPSSSSSSPAPTPPPPTEYYDDFSDPVRTLGDATHDGALRPIEGLWYIAEVPTSEAIVGRSRLHLTERETPGFIIHPLIRRTGDVGYWTFSTIRPHSLDSNGYVIFGYKGDDDFWYAGHSIKTLDAPYGYLFVGHKTGDLGSALDNWPRGLDFGHQFDAAGDPNIYVAPAIFPGTLLGIDVRTEVKVTPIVGSDRHLVHVDWYWNRSGQGFPNPTTPFDTCEFSTAFSVDGFCGMGAVACETHWDDFGILDLP